MFYIYIYNIYILTAIILTVDKINHKINLIWIEL